MTSPITEKKKLEDLVKAEWDHRGSRIQARFENDTGSAAAFEIGHVLEFDTNHYQPADGTSFGAVLAQNVDELANGAGVDNVAMIVRGPVIVNEDELEWDAGATQADILTAMKAAGVIPVKEPTNQETLSV